MNFTNIFKSPSCNCAPLSHFISMEYTVTISGARREHKHRCAGPNDQVALIYAGKIVEAYADRSKTADQVTIKRDGLAFGPVATVRGARQHRSAL